MENLEQIKPEIAGQDLNFEADEIAKQYAERIRDDLKEQKQKEILFKRISLLK